MHLCQGSVAYILRAFVHIYSLQSVQLHIHTQLKTLHSSAHHDPTWSSPAGFVLMCSCVCLSANQEDQSTTEKEHTDKQTLQKTTLWFHIVVVL